FDATDAALVPYITAGDPEPDATAAQVRALAAGGADVIEIGLPFSEPIADGPTIQNAIQRSLDAGMTPERFFEIVSGLDVDVPLVCMTYYNLIYQYGSGGGVELFVEAAASAGIDGLIVPDLPVEESDSLKQACETHGLDLIFIVAPTTRDDRLDHVMEQVSGFVYVQARLGTTGARADVSEHTHESLSRLSAYDVPRAVGFGVSEAEHAREIVSAGAEGVVAGSVFVDIIAEHGTEAADALEAKAHELKEGALSGVAQRTPRPERT
ncbi:MAG TPA: tryptophan synthase subunit alpha, partial [Halococcus sp.]|nr:tryptophan synthase subunit alpha [Halococcus sp.]